MSRRLLLLLPLAALIGCESTLKESPQYGSPTGQVTTGATLTPPPNPCLGCALAPTTFTRKAGQTIPELREFPGDPQADYLMFVQDDGEKSTGVEIKLNGEIVVPQSALTGVAVVEIKQSVLLKSANRLTVLPLGRTGAKVTVWILSGAKVIGAQGGTVKAPGALAAAVIPQGALTAPVDITLFVQDIPGSPSAIGTRQIAAGPEGIAFAKPVTLSLVLPGTPDASAFMGPRNGNWVQWWPTLIDSSTKTLTVSTSHFSLWIGWQSKLPLNGPYTIDLTSSVATAPRTPALSKAGVQQTIAEVAAAWTPLLRLTPNSNSLTVPTAGRTPDIEVVFSDLLGGGTLGLTEFDILDQNHRRVTIDTDWIWRTATEAAEMLSSQTGFPEDPNLAKTEDLYTVLAHEVGHAIGLDHPYWAGCSAYSIFEDYTTLGFALSYFGLISLPDPCVSPPLMAAFDRQGLSGLGWYETTALQRVYSASSAYGYPAILMRHPLSPSTQDVGRGAVVPLPPRVVVLDANDNAVEGALVTFYTTSASGVTAGWAVTSDSKGEAAMPTWTMPMQAINPVRVRAEVRWSDANLQGEFDTQGFVLNPVNGGGPGTLVYSDDFSHGLGNWVVHNPDLFGSWTTQNGELIGDYNITCGSSFCNQTQLLLADNLQPALQSGSGNWRMEVQSGLTQAYCCFNGGAMVNIGKFSLWVSDNEKYEVEVGKAWQGLQAPASESTVDASRQAFPWHTLGFATVNVSSWAPATFQNAALEKHGNQYTLFFNGVQVDAFSATFSSPPKIGFGTYGQVRLDNFKLFSLP